MPSPYLELFPETFDNGQLSRILVKKGETLVLFP